MYRLAWLLLKEVWVLCRVFQKRKDGEQDNAAGSSSPTFDGSSSQAAVAMPDDHQPMVDAYFDQAAGFAPPPQEDVVGGFDPLLVNAAMWQYGSVLDHFPPQEVTSSPMMAGLGSRGVGDGCGGFYYDTGFEDMANIGGMGFPQGWMG
ncbi:NAC domain-containing protein 21/22-like [Panicum miliaceum]|uniref:NAC domain-containing protein 21/22-like n=1 Tax=Panicum miliaceum TaxID=4540 RepID=A0A3L6PV46_PANMI|nr:NAC domain-containing protein 21/22-like [Panicum miliaceum]